MFYIKSVFCGDNKWLHVASCEMRDSTQKNCTSGSVNVAFKFRYQEKPSRKGMQLNEINETKEKIKLLRVK